MSIAQMINHYGTPSTGLDGTPYIYYHYGSHWIAAQLSRFTSMPTFLVYNFGFPVLFVSLFLKVFVQFALSLQMWLFNKLDDSAWFVLVLMCLLV
ncbi:MAG: hypothetical protein ACKPFK_34250, partial [Dolichospermum sp.]